MPRLPLMNMEGKQIWRAAGVCVLLALFLSGWDFSKHNIPLNEIKSGGPPKDGIPELTEPAFVSAETAGREFLDDTDRVLGLHLNGKAKAYPVKILNWHELINDELGGKKVLVTYCPLCGTGMVFDAGEGRERKLFGVSGLLYQSDMLLYDQATESLWSQIKSEAVTGKLTGEKLILLASQNTSWKDWKRRHPGTQVLSQDTGYSRDYSRNPYVGYKESGTLFFPVNHESRVFSPKETVVGVEIDGLAKAYPFKGLGEKSGFIKDKIGKRKVTVFFDAVNKTAIVRDEKGRVLPSVMGFWFAWFAFHPETGIFKRDH